MKTITINSNFGRFATSVACEIGDEVNGETTVLCESGLANELFRLGGSAGEKALVASGGEDVNGKRLSKDTKRSEIGYDSDRAKVLEVALNAAFSKARASAKEKGETALPEIVATVTGEHEYGEAGQSRKMATALVAQMRAEKDANKRAARFIALGVDESEEDAVVVEAAHAFLASLRKG